jgi:hypothetical protein
VRLSINAINANWRNAGLDAKLAKGDSYFYFLAMRLLTG